jgi:hypothetical protein
MNPRNYISQPPLTARLAPLPPKQIQQQFDPPPAAHQTHKEAVRQLQQEIGNSNEILIRATAVFPFNMFRDSITVDRNKLTITKRTFFGVAEVMSVRIEDLLHVNANVGPFFGSLRISNRFFDAKRPYEVHYLKREDALRIKRILQGYIIATQKQIDCSSFKTPELARMLDELGQASDGPPA